jgi:hypothetical protein
VKPSARGRFSMDDPVEGWPVARLEEEDGQRVGPARRREREWV